MSDFNSPLHAGMLQNSCSFGASTVSGAVNLDITLVRLTLLPQAALQEDHGNHSPHSAESTCIR